MYIVIHASNLFSLYIHIYIHIRMIRNISRIIKEFAEERVAQIESSNRGRSLLPVVAPWTRVKYWKILFRSSVVPNAWNGRTAHAPRLCFSNTLSRRCYCVEPNGRVKTRVFDVSTLSRIDQERTKEFLTKIQWLLRSITVYKQNRRNICLFLFFLRFEVMSRFVLHEKSILRTNWS